MPLAGPILIPSQGNESVPSLFAPVAQLAEAIGLAPICSGFWIPAGAFIYKTKPDIIVGVKSCYKFRRRSRWFAKSTIASFQGTRLYDVNGI